VVVGAVDVADVAALAPVVVDEMLDSASATGVGRAYSLDPQPASTRDKARTASGVSTRTNNSRGGAGTAAVKIAYVSLWSLPAPGHRRAADFSPKADHRAVTSLRAL
jgi:hypothetical protein